MERNRGEVGKANCCKSYVYIARSTVKKKKDKEGSGTDKLLNNYRASDDISGTG